MSIIVFGYAMALLISKTARCSPIIDTPEQVRGLRYEEYIIEHDISTTQAKNSVLSYDLNSLVTPPGCQTCTADEIRYCLSQDLVSDHCCCDKRYHEVLPFIPHTCYFGTRLCKPVVADCELYTRLRNCCCDKYVLQKWKRILSDNYKESEANVPQGILIWTLVNIILCLYI